MTPTEKDLLEVTELRKGLPADVARNAKIEVLNELATEIAKMAEKHKEKAYKAGQLDYVAEARYSEDNTILAMIVGIKNNI